MITIQSIENTIGVLIGIVVRIMDCGAYLFFEISHLNLPVTADELFCLYKAMSVMWDIKKIMAQNIRARISLNKQIKERTPHNAYNKIAKTKEQRVRNQL